MFLKRLGIDLGTNNVLVYIPSKGIVINEPCVVALETLDNKVMAIGNEAKEMLGRTPESIIAAKPLRDGVIASYRITQAMLKYFIDTLGGRIRLIKPDVMIAIPAGITSTERRAVIDACLSAGAKNAYIIKAPIAAALGAGIPIASSSGHMIIDIGGGTTETAVISLGDIVASTSVRIGGNKMDQAIANYIRKKYNLVIGERTAELVKIQIGSLIKLKKDLSMEVSGCNAITGLPESIIVKTPDVTASLKNTMSEIVLGIKTVLQKTPPELASDVMDKGIILTGGGARLRGFDKLLTNIIGVPCEIADEPELCVVKGTGVAIDNLENYKKSVLWAK